MKREEIRWISKRPECEGGRRGFLTVGLIEIKPAIYLLLIGYAISSLICIAEYLLPKIVSSLNIINQANKKPIVMITKSNRS